jgi:hypothetical protein
MNAVSTQYFFLKLNKEISKMEKSIQHLVKIAISLLMGSGIIYFMWPVIIPIVFLD